jgi:hypothetical protein
LFYSHIDGMYASCRKIGHTQLNVVEYTCGPSACNKATETMLSAELFHVNRIQKLIILEMCRRHYVFSDMNLVSLDADVLYWAQTKKTEKLLVHSHYETQCNQP